MEEPVLLTRAGLQRLEAELHKLKTVKRAEVAAAIREAQEEIGLDPAHIDPLGFSDPFHTRTGFWVTPLVALVSSQATFMPNPHEVAEIFETPLLFLMDPANHELRTGVLRGQTRQYYAMDHEGRVIWGVTAGILRVLYLRLYGAVSDA